MDSDDDVTPGSGGDASDSGGSSVAVPAVPPRDSEGSAGSAAMWAAQLFVWNCLNCTKPNGVSPPSPDMLAFAGAFGERLASQRRLAAAKRAFAAELAQFEARSIEVAALVASGLSSEPAEVPVRPERPDFEGMAASFRDVPEPPAIPQELMSRQVCDSCGAPFAPPSGSVNTLLEREHVLAAIAAGLEVGPEDRLRLGLPTPQAADAATAAAAAATGAAAAATAAAAADIRPLQDYVDGKASTTLPPLIPAANSGLLLATLNDDDPRAYLDTHGLTDEWIGAVLRLTPEQEASAAAAVAAAVQAAASDAAVGPPAPEAAPGAALASSAAGSLVPIALQKRRAQPACQAFAQGFGGFAPVVAVAYDERMLLHEEGGSDDPRSAAPRSLQIPGVRLPARPAHLHPERPDRLRAIAQQLVATGLFQRCLRVPARPVTDDELAGVHTRTYVEALRNLGALVEDGGGHFKFSSDTFANAFTLRAAQLACGSVVAVTQAVVSGASDRGVALVRPPGHHAEPDAALGFCLYNNVAVAASVARLKLGVSRVMIVDWDVHHGNGTQHMFESDPSVLYVSLHRFDRGTFYPGTGAAAEVGDGPGAGYNVNIPWDCGGMGDAEYLHAFDAVIMPIARSFDPELVLVSAGFDAARGDPLGGCDVTPAGYAHMTHRLLSLARGRVVVALEGGYNLASISRSMEAVVRVLLGESPPPLAALPPWVHAPPSEESAGLKGPGAAYFDAVMEMVRQGTHVPPASAAAAGAAAGAADAAGPSSNSATPCAHGHRHHAHVTPRHVAPRADVFTPTRAQAAACAAEQAGLDRDEVLAGLSPAASAADTVAWVTHLHSSYWPCLRAPYKASKRWFKAAASAYSAAAALAGASLPGPRPGGAGGVGAAVAAAPPPAGGGEGAGTAMNGKSGAEVPPSAAANADESGGDSGDAAAAATAAAAWATSESDCGDDDDDEEEEEEEEEEDGDEDDDGDLASGDAAGGIPPGDGGAEDAGKPGEHDDGDEPEPESGNGADAAEAGTGGNKKRRTAY